MAFSTAPVDQSDEEEMLGEAGLEESAVFD
jgi:hypothetical protein